MASFAANCLVDKLCNDVNILCLNPVSQNTYQPADITVLMDRALSLVVVPLLKTMGQEFFVYNVDVPILQGQSAYTFPSRAIGNSVRDVVLLDASGNEVALNNLMREYIKIQFPFNFVPSIWSFGMYLTSNEIQLWNTLIQSYTAYKLRFITERRPGGLTLSSNCGQITAIIGNVVTLGNVDSSWTTSTTFDIINQLPPFQSRGDDLTVTLISGSQLTFSNLPSTVQVGDWVCPAMLSCIPQIPYDIFPLLSEIGAATIGKGLDMSQFLAASNAVIELFMQNSGKLVKPRVTGSPRVIINKDGMNTWANGRWGGFRLLPIAFFLSKFLCSMLAHAM